MRTAILFDNFGPYHLARLRGAAEHGDVIAVEVAARSADYAWERSGVPGGLDHVVLAETAEDRRSGDRLRRAVRDRLAPLRPDAVAVPGWSSLASLVVTDWAAAAGVPAIVMTETNGWDFRRRAAGEFIKRGVVAHYSAGLGTSRSHAGYLEELGLPAESIFFGYNAVDNGYFEREAARVRAAPALPDAVAALLPASARGRYFLASNRFIEKKNLSRLLRAYAAFREGRAEDAADWPLVILGDGDLRPALEAEIAELQLAGHVHMPGFCQYGDLPSFYGTAGAFVHASTTEQWGLVVNEAMASGLPVAVSRRCGCAEVLVRDGENGHAFDPFSTDAIRAALAGLAHSPHLDVMGAASRGIIADWGPSRFGAGLRSAAQQAVARRRRPAPGDRWRLNLAKRWISR
ncbi:MAG: glycosyltransferase [Alphaproteobacteria bacterium]|nr:glycosyltransferase [Alphaproteobacteria bacterium]